MAVSAGRTGHIYQSTALSACELCSNYLYRTMVVRSAPAQNEQVGTVRGSIFTLRWPRIVLLTLCLDVYFCLGLP